MRRERWENKPDEEKKDIYNKQYARRKELWSEERKEAERVKRRETYAKKKAKEVIAIAL
jgi:ATP-dependent Zn protease